VIDSSAGAEGGAGGERHARRCRCTGLTLPPDRLEPNRPTPAAGVHAATTTHYYGHPLYANHVAQLLDEAVCHSEHLRLGLTDTPDAAS
jgi:hypothetical protein